MTIEATIQALLEESRKLEEANRVTRDAVGPDAMPKLDADQSAEDEPSNKRNNVVTQKEGEGGTSKKPNRATQGAVAPEAMKKLGGCCEGEEADDDFSSLTEDEIEELDTFIESLDEEAFEQLDEVSKKLLGRYVNKATGGLKGAVAHAYSAGLAQKDNEKESDARFNKAVKRVAGVSSAVKRLTKEDIDALFNGEEGLTEEFRAKAETIFEAAVTSRVKEEAARIEEAYEQKLAEELESAVEGLVEHVDGYLNLMVEQWIEQNAIALEAGLKADILESFVEGMKNLFAEHYVEVPEEKYDVLGDLEAQIADLTEKLNESVAKTVELRKQVDEATKQSIIDEATDGLSDLDADKLKTLAEEISFEDADSFAGKIKTIRESYFSKKAAKSEASSLITEGTQEDEKPVPVDMQQYVKAISILNR